MYSRFYWLPLVVLLAACSGESDSTSVSPSTFPGPTPAPVTSIPSVRPVVNSWYGARDGVAYSDVSEKPSSKQQAITINGEKISFTATAGHLLTYDWIESRSNSLSKQDAEAAIFYTAYTRDAVASDTRPVTFVFNGGPGGASSALDINMLGPKAVVKNNISGIYELQDNSSTLLDKTDLVFVDPVGTGYSAAVKPNKNIDYWGSDSDAEVLSDFIVNYINVNKRYSSPKYIYGVSYGGMRAPIIARLLLDDGTRNYSPDISGTAVDILSGVILNSPILDYKTDCSPADSNVSCGGVIPTYAMVASYHKKSTAIGNLEFDAFAQKLREFAITFTSNHSAVFSTVYSNPLRKSDRLKWDAYLKTAPGAAFVDKLYSLTGIGGAFKLGDAGANNPWIKTPNMGVFTFIEKFDPAKGKLTLNDGRVFVPMAKVDPMMDRTDLFNKSIKQYLEDFTGYKTDAVYLDFNATIIDSWDFMPKAEMSLAGDRVLTSLTDLAYAKSLNNKLKILVQHGYYDLNTPFHQSELDIEHAGLQASVPVSIYEGGHGLSPDSTKGYDQVISQLRALYGPVQQAKVAAFKSTALEGVTQ